MPEACFDDRFVLLTFAGDRKERDFSVHREGRGKKCRELTGFLSVVFVGRRTCFDSTWTIIKWLTVTRARVVEFIAGAGFMNRRSSGNLTSAY